MNPFEFLFEYFIPTLLFLSALLPLALVSLVLMYEMLKQEKPLEKLLAMGAVSLAFSASVLGIITLVFRFLQLLQEFYK